jgi:hypothetical protein
MGSGFPQLGFPRRFAMNNYPLISEMTTFALLPTEFDSKKPRGDSQERRECGHPPASSAPMEAIDNIGFSLVSQ